MAEIEKGIKSFENNKSPGNDGLPAEFYKTFNEILKLYIEIPQLREMQRSMWQAGISYLYKKGDREDMANWRPYAKILANKIQPKLEDTICPQQITAIKGKAIIENLQPNRDVMSYADASKIQAAINSA